MAGDAVLRESVDGFAVFSSAEPIPAELDLSAIAWAPKEEDAAEAAAAAAAAAAEAEVEEAGSEEAGSDEEDAPAAEPSAPAQEPGVQQPAAADSEPDADSPSESGTPASGSGGVSFEEEDDDDDEEDDEEEAAVATKAGTERQIIRRSQGVSAAVLFGRPGPIEESEESEDSAADSEADAAAKSPAREDESPEQRLMRVSPRGRQEKQVSAKDSGSSSEGDSSSDSSNDEQPIFKLQRAGSLSPTEKIVARKTQQLSAGKQPRAEPEGDETAGRPLDSLSGGVGITYTAFDRLRFTEEFPVVKLEQTGATAADAIRAACYGRARWTWLTCALSTNTCSSHRRALRRAPSRAHTSSM
ncbi:hypothetical protein T492DRAFT_82361 [Pavlovales sp. CCMP2436]|nr:hypothetical protein T492DRAFT_82361 [Pavlovales sp. CCMP2436]